MINRYPYDIYRTLIYRFVRWRSVVDRCAKGDGGGVGDVQSCWGRDKMRCRRDAFGPNNTLGRSSESDRRSRLKQSQFWCCSFAVIMRVYSEKLASDNDSQQCIGGSKKLRRVRYDRSFWCAKTG